MPALAQPHRKNVLLLIADDLGLHTGAYGDSAAQTPNLDRLAQEGVLFSNAFCTTASCSASRSVILSGLQNHPNGQYGHAHAEHHMAYLPKVRPFPSLLKDAGYRTGYIAKLHVEPEARFRWDMAKPHNGRSVHEMAGFARQFIQSAGSQNWYLHVGFTDPHRAAKGFANQQYPGVKWNPFDPAKVKVPGYLPDSRPVREEVAEYYQAANRLDQGIGFFLDVLKEAGQLDNTLVIFMSDNGMPFANAKTNCYDAGMHLPLIVRSPDQTRRGLRNNAMVNWTSIAPTILDWAGAKLPEYPLHGRSFLPVLEQENPAGWDEVHFSHTFHEITMYYPMRVVRTRRHKLIWNLAHGLPYPFASDLWGAPTWQDVYAKGPDALYGKRAVKAYLHRPRFELYDLESDPHEVKNLADDPAHAALLKELQEKLKAFQKRTKDPWILKWDYE